MASTCTRSPSANSGSRLLETYDVIVEPSGQDAFTIFAQSMDRTGFAAGTLAVREGLRAAVPGLDARPMLTMADIGHGGMGHDMNAMSPQKPADARRASRSPIRTPVTVHQQNRPRLTLMQGIRCPRGGCSDGPDPHAGHTMPPQQPADPHAGHNMAGTSGGMQQHPSTEDGNPLVDMQTMTPTSRLDDPGIGLRDNGRRVLTYADLKRRV